VVIIGLDPHKRTHTGSALKPGSHRMLATVQVQASLAGYRQLLRWAQRFESRRWAVGGGASQHCLDLTDRDSVPGGMQLVCVIPLDGVDLDSGHASRLQAASCMTFVRHRRVVWVAVGRARSAARVRHDAHVGVDVGDGP